MEYTKLTTAILAVMSLSACSDQNTNQDNTPTMDDLVREEAVRQSLSEANKDKEEIKAFLEVAQKEDPSIVDAYYSYDENGERMLNVVRDNKGGSSENQSSADNDLSGMEIFALSAAGGMVGAMLANQMMSNPNYHNQTYRQRTYSSRSMSRNEYRNHKKSFTSSYASKRMSKNINYVKNNKTKMASLTTKRQAFINKTTKSRASTVSRGG